MEDRFGLPLGTTSATAAAAYGEGVDRMLSASVGADACFAQAIAAGDGLALAHAGLARLEQMRGRGAEAPAAAERARALAARATRRERQHADAIATAAPGDGEAFARRVAELEAAAREGRIAAGPVVPALVRALGAFARDDCTGAIALLEPVADQLVRIGGGHAQRDVFEETLVAAYLRAGALEKAEALRRRRERRCP